MSQDFIDSSANVVAFFESRVRDAARSRGYNPEAPSALYLAGLLADYTKLEQTRHEALNRPMTLLLQEALLSMGPDRFHRLRGFGDQALYLSGFFAEHLERRGVERRFICELGATAYDAAGAMLRRFGGEAKGPDVFDELATNFGRLVGVLGEIADAFHATGTRDPQGVLDIYERWQKRGSPALAEALVQCGIMPTRGGGALH